MEVLTFNWSGRGDLRTFGFYFDFWSSVFHVKQIIAQLVYLILKIGEKTILKQKFLLELDYVEIYGAEYKITN